MELNPIANSGTLQVNVLNPEDEPVENIHVAMIPHYHYDNYTYEHMQEEAWFQGTTGSDGMVTFEQVPANDINYNSYAVFVYHDEDNYEYPGKSYYIR